MGRAQTGPGVSGGQHHHGLDDPGMAARAPAHAQGMDHPLGGDGRDPGRTVRDLARGAGRPFALRSHKNAARAFAEGAYAAEIIDVPGVDLARDEGIRDNTSMAALAALKPAFLANGSVTAGDSSPLNDRASAVLLGAENALPGAKPLARVIGRGVAGNDPGIFGIAPVEAANRALARAGKTWSDVDLVELNEAYAAQSIACLRWPELGPEKVNVDGGAIAMGHPLGASGGRIVGHLAHALAVRGGGIGVATICIGVGQGLAVVLEA